LIIIVNLHGSIFLKKSDVFNAFVNFQKLIDCKLDKKILTIQSD
jgi:hypothetical protein